MTPEIDLISTEITTLKQKLDALIQVHLSTNAIAQVGELITWERCGSKTGRVIQLEDWFGAPAYVVRNILKSGGDGSVTTVRPYNKPTRHTAG